MTKVNTKTVTLPTAVSKTSQLTNDSDFTTSSAMTLAISAAVSGLIRESDVQTMITNLIGGAPEEFDTLKEIADKLASSDSDVAALVSQLSSKVNTSDLSELTAEEINAIWNEVFV